MGAWHSGLDESDEPRLVRLGAAPSILSLPSPICRRRGEESCVTTLPMPWPPLPWLTAWASTPAKRAPRWHRSRFPSSIAGPVQRHQRASKSGHHRSPMNPGGKGLVTALRNVHADGRRFCTLTSVGNRPNSHFTQLSGSPGPSL
jgi:hypothetical protein